MGHYYNEFDPFASKWLRKLFPTAEVDARSIVYVEPEDVIRATQAHFFGGIGGWSLAMQIAGWPKTRKAWTGSCPCQPFSIAGEGLGEADPRHLWPQWRRLIEECGPPVIFGEQVASPDGRKWLARVRADLERMGYRVGCADLCAAGVRAPNLRQRLWFVADASSIRPGGWPGDSSDQTGEECGRPGLAINGGSKGLVYADSSGRIEHRGASPVRTEYMFPERASCLNRVGDAARYGLRISRGATAEQPYKSGYWSVFDVVECRDGKSRRMPPAESCVLPLADGVPNRVGRLSGYGNSINVYVAATFIRAYMETIQPQ